MQHTNQKRMNEMGTSGAHETGARPDHLDIFPAAPKKFGRAARRVPSPSGRSMIEMLGVLAIIGVLSITALVGFTYAMNKHRANETIYDVMLRGTNVPMVDENYASKPAGHEFRFPDLPAGTYYPMTTKKDAGSSYYVEATGVTYRVCEMILKMNPTDIDQIVVGNTVYQGDSDICGTSDGLAMKFCFGEDGTICDGTGHGGSSGGSGSGSSGGTSSGSGSGSGSGSSGSGTEPDLCADVLCGGCQSCDSADGQCKDNDANCSNGQACSNGTCVCTDDSQCGSDEICQSGTCVQVECKGDAECSEPQVCEDNVCVCPPVGEAGTCQVKTTQNGCDVITTADDGTACAGGVCSDGACVECLDETQCDADNCETCVNKTCQSKCVSGETCDGNGVCESACSSGQTSCSDDSGSWCCSGSQTCGVYKVCCTPLGDPDEIIYICPEGVITDINGCPTCAGICTDTIFHWPDQFDNMSVCESYCTGWKDEWSTWCQSTAECDYDKGFKCEMYGPCDYETCSGGRFSCTPFYYNSVSLRWENYNDGSSECR